MKSYKIVNAYIKGQEGSKCNHNPLDVNNTLQEVNRKMMTFPEQKFFVCKECHKGLRFVKNKNGDFVEESVPTD